MSDKPTGMALGMTGIGWRHPHYGQVLETLPRVAFLEVHSENFFALGGAALATLAQARSHYDVSLHGVGLGLGSASGIDSWHLDRLQQLVERIDPIRVSDHACFARGSFDNSEVHAADLLPIPFNTASLEVMCANVQRVQERLKRSILVENLSAYVTMTNSDNSVGCETDFLNQLTRRTGCQLVIDVNNIYVNALNAQQLSIGKRDAQLAVQTCSDWLDAINLASPAEIHLAGHCVMPDIVIDDHGARVDDAVWRVYAKALGRFGALPTLIEWDTAIPPLQVLLEEAARADEMATRDPHTLPPTACPNG